MGIVTNDMVLGSKFKDKYEAIAAIKESLRLLVQIRDKTNFAKLLSSRNIYRGMELAEGYYFEQLFSENNELFSQKEKSLLRTLLVNFNMFELPEDRFIYDGKESKQCAWTYLHQGCLFSIAIETHWLSSYIRGSLIDENNKRLEVDIPNIANAEHLDIHRKKLGIRKYEFNPKHKINVGWGTEMDLNDDEAQKLLLYALPVDREENHLVARKNGKYYSFRCHHGNCYHGYWDNTMPENNRRVADRTEDKRKE